MGICYTDQGKHIERSYLQWSIDSSYYGWQDSVRQMFQLYNTVKCITLNEYVTSKSQP